MTETHYLTDILILLAAAIVMVPIFQRLGLGSVLGYLAAGTLDIQGIKRGLKTRPVLRREPVSQRNNHGYNQHSRDFPDHGRE